MVTLWWSAAHLIHYSCLNPVKTIISEKYTQQVNDMHWKLQRLQLGIGQQNGPNSFPWQCPTTHPTTSASEVNRIWLWRFALSAMFTWPLGQLTTTFSSISRIFLLEKMVLKPAGGRKCFPRVHEVLKHGCLHYRNKPNLYEFRFNFQVVKNRDHVLNTFHYIIFLSSNNDRTLMGYDVLLI